MTIVRCASLLICLALVSCGGGGKSRGEPSPQAPTYSIGGQVTGLNGASVTLVNNGARFNVTADGAFAAGIALPAGAAYDVRVLALPDGAPLRCVVANGSGTVGTAPVTNIAVTCSRAYLRFAYGLGENDQMVSYRMEDATGVPQILNHTDAGFGANSMAVDPAGRVAYTVYSSGQSTYGSRAFQLDTATGFPTRTPGRDEAQFGGMSGARIDPLGRYYFFSVRGVWSTFSIDGSLPPGGFGADQSAGSAFEVALTFEPRGRFAYALQVRNGVAATKLDLVQVGGTAVLTRLESIDGPDWANAISIDPTGRFLYVRSVSPVAGVAPSIKGYSIAWDTGRLTAIDGNTVAAPTADYILGFDRDGQFAYLGSGTTDTVSIYSIHVNSGQLTFARTSQVPGASAQTVSMDPTGRYAYVGATFANRTTLCSVDAATGALTPVTVLRMPAPRHFVLGDAAVTDETKFVFTANAASNDVSVLAAGAADGSMSALPAAPAGLAPSALAADATGRYLFVTNSGANSLTTFEASSAGALTPVAALPYDTGAAPAAVTMAGNNAHVYVLNPGDDTFSTYTWDVVLRRLTPILAPVTQFAAGTQPRRLAVDPLVGDGYLLTGSADSVTRLPATAGVFFPPGTAVAVGQDPAALVIDPRRRFLFVANEGSDDVSVIGLESFTTVAGSPFAAGDGPCALALNRAGSVLYVANCAAGTLTAFGVNAGTGALTPLGTVAAAQPSALAVDPAGLYLRVLSTANNSVSSYAITLSGALAATPSATAAVGTSPAALAVTDTTH